MLFQRVFCIISATIVSLVLPPETRADDNVLKFELKGRYLRERDKNEWMEHMSDREFNAWNIGYLLNGDFIKNEIGIDQYKVRREERLAPPYTIKNIGKKKKKIHIPLEFPGTVKIGETEYMEFYNFLSTEDSVRLVSLDDIRKSRFPDCKEPCVYMINKFFIFHDQGLYKIEEDFIYDVEMFYSDEVDALKKFPRFAIIRVFTRTEHNRWWQYSGE